LLIFSVAVVAAALARHWGPSEFLSRGDPTQLTHPSMPTRENANLVVVTTPDGVKHNRYMNFQHETSVVQFLNDLTDEFFGRPVQLLAAQAEGTGNREQGIGNREQGTERPFEETHPTTESVARQAGYHRGLVEGGGALHRTVQGGAYPHYVHVVARHKDGTVFYDQWFHNLRTNAGINWQYNQMAGTTAAVCTYFALSNDSGAPAATDTAVASEITTNGLARVNATAAHTSNATSYTLSYTFTATGTQSAQKIGVLNASSGGTLCFENTFTQVSMVSGDTLAVTYTINF
jgi:hypothetical protein